MKSETLENTKSDNNRAIDQESNRKSISEKEGNHKVSKRGDTEVKKLGGKSKTNDGRSISKKDKKLGHRREVDGGKVAYKNQKFFLFQITLTRSKSRSTHHLK